MNPLSLLQPGWKGVLIAAGIGLITGLSAGGWLAWHFTSVSYEAQVSHLKEQHANDLKVISDAAAKNRDDNASAEHSAANQIARDDQKHTQELNDALAENQTLRDAVSTGARQLRIAKAGLATCQLSKDSTSGTSGVGSPGAIEFSADFGRNIYDIRSGIISDQQKLRMCQAYIRAGQQAGVIAK